MKFAAVAAIVLFGLAGCAAEKVAPVAIPSVSPSPSPSPVKVTLMGIEQPNAGCLDSDVLADETWIVWGYNMSTDVQKWAWYPSMKEGLATINGWSDVTGTQVIAVWYCPPD